MAVEWVKRIGNRPADETGVDGSYPLRFKVKVDDAEDQAVGVLGYAGLPSHGDLLSLWEPLFARGNEFRCVHRHAVDTDSPRVFEVECEFATQFDERADRHERPLDRRATVDRVDRDITIPFLRTTDDALVTNTAGDPFSPPLTTTLRGAVYTVRYFSATIDAWHNDYRKLTNVSPIWIRGQQWPAKTLLINSVSIKDELWGQDQLFYGLTVVIHGDPRDHRRHVLNDGLFETPGGNADKRRRCRIGNREVTTPVPLNNDGEQIPEADLLADPVNAPVFLDLEEFEAVDFSAMLPPLDN
ncbi:MAG: hypothetical protein ACYTGL_13810 [Planctomycetota bacterium]|jgi:hypothetical protein